MSGVSSYSFFINSIVFGKDVFESISAIWYFVSLSESKYIFIRYSSSLFDSFEHLSAFKRFNFILNDFSFLNASSIFDCSYGHIRIKLSLALNLISSSFKVRAS
jgi:hypothetical protein